MATRRVGIRELKATLSECIREVRNGHAIVITEHGRPVARIVREGTSARERIELLQRVGAVAWSGQKLRVTRPVARVLGKTTISDLVIENRE